MRVCPHCNQIVDDSPIATLLNHIKTQYKNAEQNYKDFKKLKDVNTNDYYHLKNAEKKLNKWKSWYDALSKLIEEDKIFRK